MQRGDAAGATNPGGQDRQTRAPTSAEVPTGQGVQVPGRPPVKTEPGAHTVRHETPVGTTPPFAVDPSNIEAHATDPPGDTTHST